MAVANTNLSERIDSLADSVEAAVIKWRRQFHQFPELSNREVKTARAVADHLQSLGLEVRTGVAHTGVIGVLNGGKPGAVVALRADMDALPVKEEVDIPFASREVTEYENQQVNVMHACGHDAHTAILMGVAQVLAQVKAELPGTIVFIFQPAEEGAPEGEEGGAELMIKEGALSNPRPEAVFGLHVLAGIESGTIGYRPGPTLASCDAIDIVVHGKQTHGALPWKGVDPVVTASQIVVGLQTIPSRQMDLTLEPLVVTIACIHGGVRENIIPDTVSLKGTLRTFNQGMREEAKQRISKTAQAIAEAAGAKADVRFISQYDVTVNDEALTARMVPTLKKIAGPANVKIVQKLMGSEDFSMYSRIAPGFFYLLGVTKASDKEPAPNHSPKFFIDEAGLKLGVRSLAHLALDYLSASS